MSETLDTKITETTNAHFCDFKRAFVDWLRYWGLLDWEVSFFHQKLDEQVGAIEYNFSAKQVSAYFSTEICGCTDIEYDIKLTAFHEVCELLLAQLREMSNDAHSFDVVDSAIHSIINRLQNKIFGALKEVV